MNITIGMKFRMFIFVEEFFVTDNASITGLHQKSITLEVETRSLPFMFQFFRCDGNGCVAIRSAYVIDQLRHSFEVAPFRGAQAEAWVESYLVKFCLCVHHFIQSSSALE